VEDIVEKLKKVSIFTQTSNDVLQEVAKHAVTRHYAKNSVVVCEGDDTNSLYLILKGKVKVFLSDDNGKEVLINVQGENDYFGELALLDSEKRSAMVMTIENSTFLVISQQDFEKILETHPEIMPNIVVALCRRIRSLTNNVRNLALLDVYGRVAKTLIDLSHEENGQMMVLEKITQQDIANRVGASREMVSRILKDLSSGGYISYDKRHIVINNKLPAHY